MTLEEYYNAVPVVAKNILNTINSQVLGNLWRTITNEKFTALNNHLFVFNFEKELNPKIEKFLSLNGWTLETLSTQNVYTLYQFLFVKYIEKWTKLWNNVYSVIYNPIWNVEGTDQTVHTFEHGKTTQETRNMTDTHNKGATETTTITSDITTGSRSGFNSASMVDTDKSSRTGSSNVTGSGNDSDVMTGTDTFTNSGVDTERTTLTRGMNIGVQSTQSLIEQEIELRMIFSYFDVVIADILNELTLNIYI